VRNHAAFIWSVAGLLWGGLQAIRVRRVILPLVVLRRLDCVLDPTKTAVLARCQAIKGKVENIDPVLEQTAGSQFFNTR